MFTRALVTLPLLIGHSFCACGEDDPPVGTTEDAGGSSGGSSGITSGSSGTSGTNPRPDGGREEPPAPPLECTNADPGALPNGVRPGALTFPSPTIRNASMVWELEGDQNENATVEFRFRKLGDDVWSQGLPLRSVPALTIEGVTRAHQLIGAIFDLEPATSYEVEARMLDPDGGCEVRTGQFSTRAVPTPMPGAQVKSVTVATLSSTLASAAPGDILELSAGTYPGFQIPRDGEPGKPIVVRAAAGATIEGEIGLFDRSYIQLRGLDLTGRIRINRGRENAVVGSTIRATAAFEGHGIVSYLGAENLYIADNTIQGLSTTWDHDSFGVSGDNSGEGIVVTGPGHVIEHNRVTGFRDCLSTMEGDEAVNQHSIDFIENDVSLCMDDGVEADFCLHNCRTVRNRVHNTFISLSSQPGLGGPNYFVRNVITNAVLVAIKPLRGSVGDVLLHNTIVKTGDCLAAYTDANVKVRHMMTRGNLFFCGPGGEYGGYDNGDGAAIMMTTAEHADLDYDGFAPLSGFFGKLGATRFDTFDELRANTTEVHAAQLDTSALVTSPTFPTVAIPAWSAPDLQLAPGGAAVDRGVHLPNVTDHFVGAAPDLGAYEIGATPPAYGPR